MKKIILCLFIDVLNLFNYIMFNSYLILLFTYDKKKKKNYFKPRNLHSFFNSFCHVWGISTPPVI